MSEIQYQTAKTVKEAAKFMLAAKGKGYICGRSSSNVDRTPA